MLFFDKIKSFFGFFNRSGLFLSMQKNKLLIISSVWVEPNSSAAGSRMLQLISFFLAEGYQITYASTSASSEFAENLYNLGVETNVVKMNCASFDSFVVDFQPDVVLFDRFMVEEQFGWRVAQQCPEAVRILDTEDLHCLREARRIAYKNKITFSESLLFSDVAKREIASIFRCDLTLMISEIEIELLPRLFKVEAAILFYLPIVVERNNQAVLRKNFGERTDFVFIGNFLHEPNWNCVQVLKNEIWPPLSRELPQANLYIYGAYPSQKVFQLHNPKERFFIKGRAENAAEVIESAKVMLAPIRFGAGIKGKLLEAMVCGTPSVTTSIGAEAMHNDLPWNGTIADDNDDFVTKAIALYCERGQWEQAQQNGFAILEEKFSSPDFLKSLSRTVSRIRTNLEQHRQNNFIGAMLQHHTLKSTHYMSKWIEFKNSSA